VVLKVGWRAFCGGAGAGIKVVIRVLCITIEVIEVPESDFMVVRTERYTDKGVLNRKSSARGKRVVVSKGENRSLVA